MKGHKVNIPPTPFYFVRHGNTDWNKENRMMGQIDIPLNQIGIGQANALAEKLAHLDISHIFSSPLKRAIQTSEIIAKPDNIPTTIIEELKNVFAGPMEGKDRGDATWLKNWKMGADIEGAESWSEFISRVGIGLKKALSHAADKKPILIVGHGSTYDGLLYILNVQTFDTDAKNCGVYFFSPLDLASNEWESKCIG